MKVLDSGIAKQSIESVAGVTTTGTMLGSPLYMSPEQMRDPKAVDKRSDIWALGVVLYELTTGRVPFEAETLTELILKVLDDEPALPPSRAREGLPAELDEVVLRCLRKRPDDLSASGRCFT